MKAIKALVAVMTALLVAGMGLLVYGFVKKAGDMGTRAEAPATAAFDPVAVALPPGGRVAEMFAVGARLVVRVVWPGGERLVVVDPGTGKVVGGFALEPGARP